MRRPVLLIFTKNTCICFPQISYINMGYGCDFIRVHLFTTKITLTHYNHIWYCRVPGHLPHIDGSLRSPPPTAPAPRSPTLPPQVTSPTTERARRKEQAFSHLLSELSPISDTTVVPSIIELQRRFPGLGKVWATTVHERLRYAKRKSFHEQVADQIIQSVVKKRKFLFLTWTSQSCLIFVQIQRC